jgi:hypothetical protein
MKTRLKKVITEVAAVVTLLFLIVSCQKEDADNVTDIDGNVYNTISAGV